MKDILLLTPSLGTWRLAQKAKCFLYFLMLYLGVKDFKLFLCFLQACHVCFYKTERTFSGEHHCVHSFNKGSGTEKTTLWKNPWSARDARSAMVRAVLLRIIGDNLGVTGSNILMWLRFH